MTSTQSTEKDIDSLSFQNKFQILDGFHSPQNIAIYSFLIGVVFGGSLIWSFFTPFQEICLFFTAVTFFHFSEYITTALFRYHDLSLNSFLLNHSTEYHVAIAISIIEYIVECLYFPRLKNHFNVMMLGLIITLLGQSLRLTGIVTAGINFEHHIAEYKKQHHKLVTHGIYSHFRHPAYTGYFYWAIGTQILLCNPLSAVLYTLALHKFFSERIPYEEELLVEFFEKTYVDYRSKTKVYIPFIY